MNYAIGIDLGTTNSCVGVWKNNKVEIIANSSGNRTTPSIVCFKEKGELIGEIAKNSITKNYTNTIYDAKRLIGRNYSDKEVQEDMKLWPFKIEKDNKDKPKIIININNKRKEYYPEQISSFILKKLKKDAEDYIGKEIKDAVITVPARFNDSQREATIEAGRIAGLNVIRTINEPTAAAIAYGVENPSNEEKKICVFDFGGGTLDISILNIKNKEFKVITTGGDTHLGGEDIDNELVKYCIEKFKEEKGIDISNNKKALRRLKVNCEKLKIELSSCKESQIDIDALAEGKDFCILILRNTFDNLCKKIFERCINFLNETIESENISKDEIEYVVLVGGSSRIPKIQEMIKKFFKKDKIKISKAINPDEAIAYGASIIAAKDKGEINNLIDLVIKEICPFSLGIEVINKKMSFVIKKNTPLPCKQTKTFVTSQDYQNKFEISVYQGESNSVEKNFFLSEFILNNITPARKRQTEMIVTFEIDTKFSLLKVSAKEIGTKNEKEIKITRVQREKSIHEAIWNEKSSNSSSSKREKSIGCAICFIF